jgi:hypothetical protein
MSECLACDLGFPLYRHHHVKRLREDGTEESVTLRAKKGSYLDKLLSESRDSIVLRTLTIVRRDGS